MELLFARRPCINYVSPAVCEGDTSGSGFGAPTIVLEPFGEISVVGGLVVAGEFPGPFFLDWTPVPGALCYNIYQIVDGELVLIFECVPQPPGGPGGGHPLPPGNPEGGDTYVVTPITPEGEGAPGNPVTTPTSGEEEPPEDPECIGGWKKLDTITPNAEMTWFEGGAELPPGTYKVTYDGGYFFDLPPCEDAEEYQFAMSYILRWNDGFNQTNEPWTDHTLCYASPEAMYADLGLTPGVSAYQFNHSFGKIGLNPSGANVITASLYVAC